MTKFIFTQGDGTKVGMECPTLCEDMDLPDTKTVGWAATNSGCCTILDDGEITIAMVGSLFAAGSEVVIVVTTIGGMTVQMRPFSLANDSWVEALPQINEAIEDSLFDFLQPYGWVRG